MQIATIDHKHHALAEIWGGVVFLERNVSLRLLANWIVVQLFFNQSNIV